MSCPYVGPPRLFLGRPGAPAFGARRRPENVGSNWRVAAR